MQPQNSILAFLQEMFARFVMKSPKFFKIWQLISGALVLITGIPQVLTAFGIHLPEELNNKLTHAIGWASRGTFIMSMLTTQSKPAAMSEQGDILKKTDDKLVFTQKSEQKAADKVEIPVVAELK